MQALQERLQALQTQTDAFALANRELYRLVHGKLTASDIPDATLNRAPEGLGWHRTQYYHCPQACGEVHQTMNVYEKPIGIETRWASFENITAGRGSGGQENNGAKGHAFDSLEPGETKTLLDISAVGRLPASG